MKLTILIPIHNKLEYTKKCLKWLEKSLIHSKNKNQVKMIIIDDGSTDDSNRWINENYPLITILKGDGNLWWGGAINLGIKYALNEFKSEFILFWNNDIKPDLNYFTNLFEIIKKYQPNTIIGSKVLHLHKPEKIWSLGGFYDNINCKIILKEKKDDIAYVDWLAGMGSLINKEIFKKIGFINTDLFPHYYGDIDFFLRAKKNGIKSIVNFSLIIWNDTKNTGLLPNNTFNNLIKTLFTQNSHLNFISNFNFHTLHAIKKRYAYKMLLKQYVRYIGKFFIHKPKLKK